MCKIFIRKKLKESLSKKDIEEIISYSFKIENSTKDNSGSNKRKKLRNSKNLWRIHLAGSTRRLIYTYKAGVVKIYKLLDVTDNQKYKAYDKITNNYKKLKKENFIDITPVKKDEISIEYLKRINKLLEDSYFMAIPEKGKISFDSLSVKFKQQKWIKKYPIYKRFFDAGSYQINKTLSILELLSINRRDLERLKISLKNKNLSKNKIKKAIKKWQKGTIFVLL